MREKTIQVSERNLMKAVGGQLFDQAPNRHPRKVEVIMKKVRDSYRAIAENDNGYYSYGVPESKLYSFIHDMLFNIPEFKELNLSQKEFEAGVGVDEESRAKFKFVSAYDKETSESWKNDFIDLDAFVRNVVNNIYMINEDCMDCFCCINEGTEKCNSCRINFSHGINYESSRKPRGKYTFSCKFDCNYGKYICCEECANKETCINRCTSSSNTCGLALYKL